MYAMLEITNKAGKQDMENEFKQPAHPTCEEPLNCTTSNQVTTTAYVGMKLLMLKYVCTSSCALESTSVSLVSRNDIFSPCASAQKGAMSGGVKSVGKRDGKLRVNGISNEINPLELTY